MGLKKYADKLDDYFERLTQGKAEKIRASHVDKVIKKLQAKEMQLLDEIGQVTKDTKKARLEHKVVIAREHIRRARLLLEKIDRSGSRTAQELAEISSRQSDAET